MPDATFNIRHYNRVRDESLDYLPEIASRLIPNGKRHGAFWSGVIFPGAARFPGSYVIDLRSGHTAMMTGGVVLRDIIKAVAFIQDIDLAESILRTEQIIRGEQRNRARLSA